MIDELSVTHLRKICDPQTLECSTSDEMQALDTIIGQERAVKALRFGLGMDEGVR